MCWCRCTHHTNVKCISKLVASALEIIGHFFYMVVGNWHYYSAPNRPVSFKLIKSSRESAARGLLHLATTSSWIFTETPEQFCLGVTTHVILWISWILRIWCCYGQCETRENASSVIRVFLISSACHSSYPRLSIQQRPATWDHPSRAEVRKQYTILFTLMSLK